MTSDHGAIAGLCASAGALARSDNGSNNFVSRLIECEPFEISIFSIHAYGFHTIVVCI